VKRNASVARANQPTLGPSGSIKLEEELGLAPMSSRHRRVLTTAIRIEAGAYRKTLDGEQASPTHDARPEPIAGLGSLKRTRRRVSGSSGRQ